MSDSFWPYSPRNFPAEVGHSQAMLTCSECGSIFLGPVEFVGRTCRLCTIVLSQVTVRRRAHFGSPYKKTFDPNPDLQAAAQSAFNQALVKETSEGVFQQILEIPQAPPRLVPGIKMFMHKCPECGEQFLGEEVAYLCRLCEFRHRIRDSEDKEPPNPLLAIAEQLLHEKGIALDGETVRLVMQALQHPVVSQRPQGGPNPLIQIPLDVFDLIIEALGREPVASEDDDLLSELMYLKETQLGK